MTRGKSKPTRRTTAKKPTVTMSIAPAIRAKDVPEAVAALRCWSHGQPVRTRIKPLWKSGAASEKTVGELPVLVVNLKKLDPKVQYLAFFLDPA